MTTKPPSARSKRRHPEKTGSVTVAPAASTQNQVVHRQESFSGPMPHPGILQGYDKVLPGAAERILAMVEAESKHQQEIDFAGLRVAERQIRRGQIFAFCLVMVAFVSCLGALFMGSEIVASVIAGTTIGALATAFVVGKITDKD